MHKVKNNFSDFLSEAALRGNIGIPGEEGSGRESWLDKITQRSDAAAREFARQNMGDIQNRMSLIAQSQRLQRGHEEALSNLTQESIREVFGTLLDDVELDLKIVTRQEIKQEMEETPDKPEEPNFEEIADENLKNQIHKRKLLRTIQQGKGLNVKAILNLSIFKDGLVEIMGEENAREYIVVLNKISNIAQFFDWTIPEETQMSMWQTREGFAGSSSIEFPEPEEVDQDDAEKVIDGLIAGEDITENPAAEEMLSGLGTRIVARGVDLSVLIHESIKGIYMLVTQAALESLYGEDAEKVIANTDTLFDELQELKFGRQMQEVLFKQVSEHPAVLEAFNRMIAQGFTDVEMASFQERLNFLFFGKIAMMGQEDAREMLELVNAILSESPEAKDMCDPLIRGAIKDLEQEAEYQRAKEEGPISMEGEEEEDEEPFWKEEKFTGQSRMSKDELNDAIIDAYSRGDMEEVERLRAMLGESLLFPRLKLSALFEKRNLN